VAFCFLLNQLFGREGWARERLARFAGEAAELRLAFLPALRVQVGAEGRIEPGGPEPAAVITLSGIAGSGAFAEELRYLARYLRLDAEEELSRVVGDVAAQRIASSSVCAMLRVGLAPSQRSDSSTAPYASESARVANPW